MEAVVSALHGLMAASKYCVAFTGAGVSALSGIAPFRGAGGLFEGEGGFLMEKVFYIEEFEKDPEFFYKTAGPFIYTAHEKTPSVVHTALAALEEQGALKAVITQNIDGLHQKAGSRRVIEMHGSPAFHYCLRCAGIRLPYTEAAPLALAGLFPRCPQCGRILKPAITFYGEALPLEAHRAACEEAQRADLLLILGTSLEAYPAADIPHMVLRGGGKLVIVNQSPTPLDSQAFLRFDSLEEVFARL